MRKEDIYYVVINEKYCSEIRSVYGQVFTFAFLYPLGSFYGNFYNGKNLFTTPNTRETECLGNCREITWPYSQLLLIDVIAINAELCIAVVVMSSLH